MVFVFGAGGLCQKKICDLEQEEVIGILDNDVNKQGTYFCGHKVLSVEAIKRYNYDYIYVLTNCVKEINRQLEKLGVSREKIRYYIDIPKRNPYMERFEVNKKKIYAGSVCLLTNTLNVSGAPNCLLTLTKVLIKYNYKVIVGAETDGSLRDAFLNIGASVYIDERLSTGTLCDIDWLKEMDIILVNTTDFYYLLREVPKHKKLIWWLHEPKMYYLYNELMLQHLENKAVADNIIFWCVSPIAREAIIEYMPDIDIDIMTYGIEDKSVERDVIEETNNIKFVVVANMDRIKGYDVLIEAIKRLSWQERKRCSFTFVGKDDNAVGNWVKNKNTQYDLKIDILGEMPNENVLKLLAESDVLICASRQESMSLSVTEALMLGKIVICSDNTGNAYYIKHRENGFLFQSENVEDLVSQIRYILEYYNQMEMIKIKARDTYTDNFSVERFEREVDRYIPLNTYD